MDPAAFLQLARALHAPNPDPADLAALEAVIPPSAAELRSALSRAYYAAFLVARETLRAACGQHFPTTKDAHELVYIMLRSSDNDSLKKAASALNQLRRARNAADYDLAPNDAERPNYVQDCLHKAASVVERCERFAALDAATRAPFIRAINSRP